MIREWNKPILYSCLWPYQVSTNFFFNFLLRCQFLNTDSSLLPNLHFPAHLQNFLEHSPPLHSFLKKGSKRRKEEKEGKREIQGFKIFTQLIFIITESYVL